MPTYDYRCEKCGVFELEQSIKDDPLKECPKCRDPVKRLISAAGIVFKGSGFHVTDNKKEKPAEKVKPKKAEPSKTEQKAEKPVTGSKSSSEASSPQK